MISRFKKIILAYVLFYAEMPKPFRAAAFVLFILYSVVYLYAFAEIYSNISAFLHFLHGRFLNARRDGRSAAVFFYLFVGRESLCADNLYFHILI